MASIALQCNTKKKREAFDDKRNKKQNQYKSNHKWKIKYN